MNAVAGGVLVLVLLSFSCKRSSDPPGDDSKSEANQASSAAPSASAAPEISKPWFEGNWSGSYHAELQRIELPKGGIRAWEKDDGKRAAGAGTLKVSIGPDGLATGEAEGPLGKQRVTGQATERGFWLELIPESQEVTAFRATLVLERAGDKVQGSLRASSGDSLTVRKAQVELKPAVRQ